MELKQHLFPEWPTKRRTRWLFSYHSHRRFASESDWKDVYTAYRIAVGNVRAAVRVVTWCCQGVGDLYYYFTNLFIASISVATRVLHLQRFVNTKRGNLYILQYCYGKYNMALKTHTHTHMCVCHTSPASRQTLSVCRLYIFVGDAWWLCVSTSVYIPDYP